MYKYGQYCPIAQAVEILGDRWTLLIVRDMLTGTRHFNDLARGLPGISKGLLAERLKRLERMGVVEKHDNLAGRKTTEYRLTQAGMELDIVINALLIWGTTWSFGDPNPSELDPLLLMWWIHDRIVLDRIPRERLVIEFTFGTGAADRYWLVIAKEEVSLCVQHPGFEVDVAVHADLKTFYQVWMGRMDYADALSTRKIEVEALPELIRDFPNWFGWSLAAPAVRTSRLSGSRSVRSLAGRL